MSPLSVDVLVTQDHIARGLAGVCSACPIALAVQDAIGGAHVEVLREQAVIHWGGYRFGQGATVDLPPKASAWLRAFDGGEAECGPFRFTLAVPVH